MQRNLKTFQIPRDIQPVKAEILADTTIQVTWPDGHVSNFAWDFFQFYQQYPYVGKAIVRKTYWGSEIAKDPPTVQYDRVMSEDDAGVAELANKLMNHGFAFVIDTPCQDPEDTRRLLERIAFIRTTHYGGFYDFKPDLSMADTAYTNIALPAHTDTTYFTDPAGLQAFHLVSHEPAPGQALDSEAVMGGESLLVDGMGAARSLAAEDPEAFRILSEIGLPWHASGNKGITISPDKRYPVLEMDRDTDTIHRIRWNNDDRGVVPLLDKYKSSPNIWYDAARKWDALLNEPNRQYWFQLKPGTTLIFDNWRILHGRNAFTGIRRMCGGYINRDDFISRWMNTNFTREEALHMAMG